MLTCLEREKVPCVRVCSPIHVVALGLGLGSVAMSVVLSLYRNVRHILVPYSYMYMYMYTHTHTFGAHKFL